MSKSNKKDFSSDSFQSVDGSTSSFFTPQSTDKLCKASVLYIEDNYSHILLLKRVLEAIPDLAFDHANSFSEGIQKAIDNQPNLIIMDMNIPGENAYNCIKALKEHARTKTTPLFALSASVYPHEIREALEQGIDKYLTKPIHIQEIIQDVEKELGWLLSDSQTS